MESKHSSGSVLEATLNLVDLAGLECMKIKGVRGLNAIDFSFEANQSRQTQSEQGVASKTLIICCIIPSQRWVQFSCHFSRNRNNRAMFFGLMF